MDVKTPKKQSPQSKTTKKIDGSAKKRRTRIPSLKAVENLAYIDSDDDGMVVVMVDSDDETEPKTTARRSSRKRSPTKKYKKDFITNENNGKKQSARKSQATAKISSSSENDEDDVNDIERQAMDLIDAQNSMLHEDIAIAGRNVFGFNTPKKRDRMSQVAAMQTPKTQNTPKQSKSPDTKKRKSTTDPKTPAHIRHRVKNRIAKLIEINSDFSGDESEFVPSSSDDDNDDSSSADSKENSDEDAADDESKTPQKKRRPIIVPVLPKTPSAARSRKITRNKKSTEFVPESDGYFQSHSSTKILTSDHTLDRLKNPRLPADRIFSLLSSMTLAEEHQTAINAMMEEYRSYFTKWMCVLNEGFNIMLYGLGSKRQLLQTFHREVLAQQTVLVINGFFPSLTLKDILDSISNEILDAGISPANPHEAVDMIEEEFTLIPDTHLYLIVHNLDGVMLRNVRSQSILARLAKIANIHLLASIDHINTPLLWDHTKLCNFNFSWWDCTTMLPYSDETAFENSLLVQNSGELALSSMRSVFSSLTTNSRGIYMMIVKYQLKNKSIANYQGMPFKDLYWMCREAFLVSSDLALRAQLTEFLDHKLVKTKRNIDGSEQLTIPIESTLLQQFLDEQEKK